jgi:transketolase
MDIGKQIGLKNGAPTRNAFGEALLEIGGQNPHIVVLDGDVANSTRTEYFAGEYPNRFFNLGIAESNLVGVASGMAASGHIPLAASFAVFLMDNAYDQIRMGIAFPNANVKLVGSHSGISIGEDGPSQMAIEDLALATALPNFTVLVPADEIATRALTRAMFDHVGPVYMRTGRPKVPVIYTPETPFEIGKANWLRQGEDAAIIACGIMVAAALDAAHELEQAGIQAAVVDMHTLKPIDEQAILQAARTGAVITAEEHLLSGGLGSIVARKLAALNPVPMGFVGIQDTYAESGEPQGLLEKYGLMPADIVAAVKDTVARK